MYQYYQPNPAGRTVGDCSVRAISKALGIDWEKAYAKIIVNGFRMNDMPSSDSVWGSVLRMNGFFRDQMLNSSVAGIQNSVTSGFGDIQNSLCSGFAGVNASVNGAQSSVTQMMYSNQIADLERSFAAQTANTQAFTGLQSQLAQCCCDNRLAVCQTQNLVSSEGAATRLAIQEQTQAILDKMCQQDIDALKAQNLALQNQVNMQALAASQATQTAALIADNTAQTQYIVNRVAPYPIPAYTVANPITPAIG